jgi:transposase
VALPKSWVVGRAFAWLKRWRRLTVDRDRTVPSCEAMIRLAMTHLALNRLRPRGGEAEFCCRKAA